MSQQSVRQAVRRSALYAQAALRKDRADRERRLEGLAVAVLTALGERDAMVREVERHAGRALLAMTDDAGLSLREAVDWWGNGVTLRELTRLRRLAREMPGGNGH
jgi:Flp pilus assembly protein TadG